jgi:Ca2+-binding EF-hand superfamily protein
MRILFPLFAAALFAVITHAQAAQPTRTHLTMEQRFEKANVTHDGHLTLEQARTGYKSVAKHFTAIDKDKKGYVTEDDIHAYYKSQRALHHQSSSNEKPTTN